LEINDADYVFLQKSAKLFRANEIFGAVVMAVHAVDVAIVVGVEPHKIECLWRLGSHLFDVVDVELRVFHHRQFTSFPVKK
jgi:hypothetical protein